jgi:hypothetical protein
MRVVLGVLGVCRVFWFMDSTMNTVDSDTKDLVRFSKVKPNNLEKKKQELEISLKIG